MNNQITKHQGTATTVFSDTCISIMDFFLEYSGLYFTPKTAALSLGKSLATVKDCMNLLRRNSYLSKESETGSVYYLSRMNIDLWIVDFKNHIIRMQQLKELR